MKAAQGFLVVRAGASRYGLALSDVREVVDVAPPRMVPARLAAMRGVMPLHQRHVSLVHLASLISDGNPPYDIGDTAVVVEVGGAPLALEVEAVEAVVDRATDFVGAAPVAWASGVWRVGAELVTVLDLGVLTERLMNVQEQT